MTPPPSNKRVTGVFEDDSDPEIDCALVVALRQGTQVLAVHGPQVHRSLYHHQRGEIDALVAPSDASQSSSRPIVKV